MSACICITCTILLRVYISHPPVLFRVPVGVVSVELAGDPFLPMTVDGFSGLGGLACNKMKGEMENAFHTDHL